MVISDSGLQSGSPVLYSIFHTHLIEYMPDLALTLQSVRQRIAASAAQCGRDPASVALLAVSKTRSAADIEAAWQQGQRLFGENYLQEALTKMEQLQRLDIEWHFIGPIQSNKTRPIAAHFDWVHSVDRLKIAERLAAQRPAELPPLQICLQVNIDAEPTKSGVAPEDAAALVAAMAELPRLTVRGLMCIPRSGTGTATEAGPDGFQRLRQLHADIKKKHPDLPHFDTLSMGMSGDLEAAIAAGATLVRVGSDIFGPRN